MSRRNISPLKGKQAPSNPMVSGGRDERDIMINKLRE
jgi:hypothetical protein